MTSHPAGVRTGVTVLLVVVIGLAGLASGGSSTDDSREVTIEGELRSLESFFSQSSVGADAAGTERLDSSALARGMPGGILAGNTFTLLLVDGRLLARMRDARLRGSIRVRATGLRHDQGRALTPFKIEYLEGERWAVFDLPLSGSAGPSAVRGDE
jgi:hypothetical protein